MCSDRRVALFDPDAITSISVSEDVRRILEVLGALGRPADEMPPPFDEIVTEQG